MTNDIRAKVNPDGSIEGEIIDRTDEANPLPPMMPPRAYEFPWPEMRDYTSTAASLMLARQSLMIGEQMLAAGAPQVTEERLNEIRAQVRGLTELLQAINVKIEAGIIAFEGRGPRLILPR